MTDDEKYSLAKEDAYKFFRENPDVKSVVFGKIRLNSDGFFHLMHKNIRHKRDVKSQLKRFELLKYLKQVLEGMKYYQEYLENYTMVKIKRNKTILLEPRLIRYWAFIAIIDDRIRLKIILKKIGEGSIFFWSIVPSWKTQGYKSIKRLKLCKGDLEQD